MRWGLLFALLLAGCSKGPDADLPSIGEARSLIAEWALVNGEAAQGEVTATYAATMRKQIREQLQQTQSQLKQPKSAYGAESEAALALADETPSPSLGAHAVRLKRIEDSLESA